jgi:hypothetical protein
MCKTLLFQLRNDHKEGKQFIINAGGCSNETVRRTFTSSSDDSDESQLDSSFPPACSFSLSFSCVLRTYYY